MMTDDQLRGLRQPAPPWTQEPATKPQIKYIAVLVKDRDVPQPWLDRIEELIDSPELFTKGKAGEIISNLKKLPRHDNEVPDRSGNADRTNVPDGRYALQTGIGDNDITFYRVSWGHSRPFVHLLHGTDETELNLKSARETIKRILRSGPGDAAVLYGQRIGRCSQCGRRLTNRLSRELAIGPVCGGRVYLEDWQERVSEARQNLLNQGIDPNEKVEDEGR